MSQKREHGGKGGAMTYTYRISSRGYKVLCDGVVVHDVQRIPADVPMTITAVQIALQRNAERAQDYIREREKEERAARAKGIPY